VIQLISWVILLAVLAAIGYLVFIVRSPDRLAVR
jgi:hypothetical protein